MSDIKSILCTNASHTIKNIYFCIKCASDYPKIQPLQKLFFCPSCFPQLLKAHSHQSDRYPVTDPRFITLYTNFRAHIVKVNSTKLTKQIMATAKKQLNAQEITKIMSTYLLTSPPIYINLLKAGNITLEDLQRFQYRKWLADVQFWKGSSSVGIDQTIQKYVSTQITPAQPVNEWNNFQIDFKSSEAAGAGSNLLDEINGASSRLSRLNQQKRLSQIFVQITSCLKNDDIERVLQECDQMKDKISKEFSFLLKLGKLKALQLHNKSSYLMKKVLQQVNIKDLNERQKELYYYFSAISQWDYIEDKDDDHGYVFLDSRNKQYYRLNGPQKYVSALTKAIEINQKPIYYACRGIGYMVMTMKQPKLYQKAQKDFSEAQKLSYKSDSMQNNKVLNKIKNRLTITADYFKQQLQGKKTEYLINMCKYLESQKDYQQHRRYSEQLIEREPNNVSFKVMLLTTLLKLKDTYSARNILSEIKDMRELENNEIAQFERKIQLLRAYEQEKVGNYEDAEGKFEHAAKFGRPSATYWFNYAAFLFKYRGELDKNQKALAAINKAIEIKQSQKPEYYELKYMLLFMMGNLQQAKTIQHLIKSQKYKGMKEYIDNNL